MSEKSPDVPPPAGPDDGKGLSSAEAKARLARYGPNEVAASQRTSLVIQALRLFANPLITILLLAALISACLGEVVNAGIILVVVLLSTTLNFLQVYRSEQAVSRLRETIAPTATARRDGAWAVVPRREIVPGDVIRLSSGDLVPADARILASEHLHVQQAPLTGESQPVEKEPGRAEGSPTDPNAPDRIFLGTSVVSGSASALATATGPRTAFGDVVRNLAQRAPETEFDRGMRQFSLSVTRIILFLILFVFLVNGALRHNPLESLLFAVALAVGLTPEFLPVLTTLTLGRGAVRMARHRVIVKNLAAIENFGSIDVLCSDKTGTLTREEMELDRCLDAAGEDSEEVFLLAYLNSFFESGIRNPLDEAVLRRRTPAEMPHRKVAEIPFDFDRRRLSVVVEKDTERTLVTKGAPEIVLPACTLARAEGEARPFDAGARERADSVCRELSGEGYRVLTVASRPLPVREKYGVGDEEGLTLEGFLAFANPPLEGAADVLLQLREDGVEVKVITGDNDLVARHVCGRVGLDPDKTVLGEEMERMSDAALGAVVERTVLFARVSPSQKNRILLALKKRGHVVGYLGDGINDAPSLHTADVGIAVASGADVAKDAADIILLERSLRALHEGILEGRKAFGNVMKYLLMEVSSNFGNMFSMAGASVVLPFLPMLPVQVLLNNFLYDLTQVAIPTDAVDPSFVRKPRGWDVKLIMRFMVAIGPLSSLFDFLTFYALLRVFHVGPVFFHTGWFVESLTTQTLVVFVIRAVGSPLRSRPGPWLTLSVLAAVSAGFLLPYTPLAPALGFAPLPPAFLAFILITTAAYLLLVDRVKCRLFRLPTD